MTLFCHGLNGTPERFAIASRDVEDRCGVAMLFLRQSPGPNTLTRSASGMGVSAAASSDGTPMAPVTPTLWTGMNEVVGLGMVVVGCCCFGTVEGCCDLVGCVVRFVDPGHIRVVSAVRPVVVHSHGGHHYHYIKVVKKVV